MRACGRECCVPVRHADRTAVMTVACWHTAQGAPDGKLAKPGKRVTVRYVGRLKSSGKVFDQTKGNRTFAFRLGVGEVIKGWDRGVEGMRVGDRRQLEIPPQMAYGTSGVRGSIPPNAWLNFDVELVDVK